MCYQDKIHFNFFMFKNETLIQHDSNVYQDVMLSSNGSILFYQIYNIKENVLHFQYYF